LSLPRPTKERPYDLLGPWAFREVFYLFSGPGGYLSPTGALLQLGAPVAKALVLSLWRLPLPQDCRPVSLRTWWARDSMRGSGTCAASCSTPDRRHHSNTTSISSGAGGGLELDVPTTSPPVSGGGMDPPVGTPPPLRRRPMLAPLPPDPRPGHGKPLALSRHHPGANRWHHSQQMPAAES
jgi:hypothetical protein